MPTFSPALLARFPEPFDNPDWLYELKYDGFRALAYVRTAGVELRSRTDHVYRQFMPLCSAICGRAGDLEHGRRRNRW
jgi:bifunctional non-homologous end joining protein LigD